ncbi:MAG: hypothetical protein ACE14T_05050 [Syntrophales bacterium]
MENIIGVKMKRFGRGCSGAVRGNPFLATLVGIGIGWLMAGGFNGSARMEAGWRKAGETAGQAKEAAATAGEKAGGVAGRTREQIMDLSGRALKYARTFGEKAQEQVSRAGSGLKHMAEEKPGVVVGTAIAIAAAVGLGYWGIQKSRG